MKKISIMLGALAIIGLSAGIFVMTSCNSNQSKAPVVSELAESDGAVSPTITATALFEISSAFGTVWVTDVIPSPESHAVLFELSVQQPDGSALPRSFRMQFSEDSAQNVMYSSSLSDVAGKNLWEFSYIVSPQAGHSALSVSSPVRSIDVVRTSNATETKEVYEVNRESFEIAMPAASVNHALDLFREGFVAGQFNPGNISNRNVHDKYLINTLSGYQDFYFRHDRFNLGPDGDLGAELFRSRELVERFKTEIDSTGVDPSVQGFWGKFCAAAGVCTYIGCEMFPNPHVCGTCGAIALGCALVELLN